MPYQDLTQSLQDQLLAAIASKSALHIIAGNSKAFYGAPTTATTPLFVSGHQGIVSYEPSELVVTVRAGTQLETLKNTLAEQGQMLASEAPSFGEHATVGGMIACGFSGPRRPFAGSVRDGVLGCTLLNGNAERCHFGGQVMKNVAGFDTARLMVGAMGQLGVILDVSLRVVPMPEAEKTLYHAVNSYQQALSLMQKWQCQPWPISALVYDGKLLRMRLAGAESAIFSAANQLGGDVDPLGQNYWANLREHKLDYFSRTGNLWRISIAPASPMLNLPGDWLFDWGGAQRWLISAASAKQIHDSVQAQGGHAICFRGSETMAWIRLDPKLMALHKRIRLAFDPHQILNPQRFNPQL